MSKKMLGDIMREAQKLPDRDAEDAGRVKEEDG